MDSKEEGPLEKLNADMLEEIEVNATAGKAEAEKKATDDADAAAAPGMPGLGEDFDAFDPKLREEILKYN